ncbi:hypothetical protein CAEBREN_24512 [Caenorhabditis brenneri]|uniref:Uncharacterized protein n=1 Tax=Caenorhabditis brenneri TaxID=135651 RepID=G0NV17_CAEBE|nr:hypothetical protein CAEBREN_24512 [Caenorhabditis brenneri]
METGLDIRPQFAERKGVKPLTMGCFADRLSIHSFYTKENILVEIVASVLRKIRLFLEDHYGRIDQKMLSECLRLMCQVMNYNQDNGDYRNPVKKLQAILQPFQTSSANRWAQFNYPNSDKKLMICVYIWFKGPCYKLDKEVEKLINPFEDERDE